MFLYQRYIDNKLAEDFILDLCKYVDRINTPKHETGRFSGYISEASVDEENNIRSIKVVNTSGKLIPYAMMDKVIVIGNPEEI